MISCSRFIALACAGLLSLTTATAQAQMHEHEHKAGSAAAAYSPGLGEIMALQQMRHSKLWFAGRARDWPLAAYEIDELKEGFEDIGKFFPMHEGISLKPMLDVLTQKDIPALARAIERRDRAAFTRAFDGLTADCNGCHRSAKHEFIHIRRPTA